MARVVQTEINFEAGSPVGLSAWQAERRKQSEALAHSLGLPLGKKVEVWLTGEIRLRGVLRLREESLLHVQATLENTVFEVDGVRFRYGDMASCVNTP